MLIFNCTKAAAEYFTVTRKGERTSCVEAPPSKAFEDDVLYLQPQLNEGEGLSQWVIHAVRVQRKHCLIVMEVETRYCMVFTAMKKGDVEGFISLFMQRLLLNMLSYGLNCNLLQEEALEGMTAQYMTEHHQFCFFQRAHRSVQSHINEVAWHLRMAVDEVGSLPDNQYGAADFDAYSNDTIRRVGKHGGWFHPDETMFLHWSARYCGATQRDEDLIRERFKAWRYDQLSDNIEEAPALPPQPPVPEEPRLSMVEPPSTAMASNVVSLEEFRARKARQ